MASARDFAAACAPPPFSCTDAPKHLQNGTDKGRFEVSYVGSKHIDGTCEAMMWWEVGGRARVVRMGCTHEVGQGCNMRGKHGVMEAQEGKQAWELKFHAMR